MNKTEENIRSLTDTKLLLILENRNEYTNEALAIVQQEVEIRNISISHIESLTKKLSREELVVIIEKLDLKECTNNEIDKWIKQIEYTVSYPKVQELVLINPNNLSPDQIVDFLINHKTSEMVKSNRRRFILNMSVFWSVYFLFMFFKEGMEYDFEIMKYFIGVSTVSVIYSIVIYNNYADLHWMSVKVSSYLFSSWSMYKHYLLYEVSFFSFEFTRNLLLVLIILIPILDLLINKIRFKTKEFKYYINCVKISLIIGFGYYFIYIMSFLVHY